MVRRSCQIIQARTHGTPGKPGGIEDGVDLAGSGGSGGGHVGPHHRSAAAARVGVGGHLVGSTIQNDDGGQYNSKIKLKISQRQWTNYRQMNTQNHREMRQCIPKL